MPRGSAPGERAVDARLTAEVQAAMLRVMRDETVDHARRDAMAKAVAPYCHPQLALVATTNETGRHADNMTEEELIKAIEERVNRLGIKIDLRIG